MPAENKKIFCFTLLEVVLAVSIFAMISAMVGGVLFSVERSYRSIRAQNEMLELKMRLESFADSTLRNAVPFCWTDTEHLTKRQIFLGEERRLIFAYLHPAFGGKETGLRFVELSLSSDCELVARYRSEPLLYWDESDFEFSESEVLASGVQNLHFCYADKESGEIVWTSEWDRELDDRIPLGIGMSVELNDGTVLKYLRRTAGSSFLSSYGKRDEKKL